MKESLRTLAGRLLYRELPEEYRYRDRRKSEEAGDLEAYLHGFGHLLDTTRGTLEQLYADAFPEGSDDGRLPQPWVLPYLADLVGAALIAPAPEARRGELANAVAWRQARGTLPTLDAIADVVANAEPVAVEGYRLTLTTPRFGAPPFSAPPEDAAIAQGQPTLAAAALPGAVGTPVLGRPMRAIASARVVDPTRTARFSSRNADGMLVSERIAWDVTNPEGVPCFPDTYDDVARRTPHVHAGAQPRGRVHPRRVAIHIRPPYGLFEPGLTRVAAPVGGFVPDPDASETVFGPADLLPAGAPVPDRVEIEGDVTIASGGRVRLHDLLVRGTLTIAAGAEVVLERSAARTLVVPPGTKAPAVEAHDCLFEAIDGASGFAVLDYVTVLGATTLERLWASECLFVGALPPLTCGLEGSCVRYSRLPPDTSDGGCPGLLARPNTTAGPIFATFYDENCAVVVPGYSAPGCGVLDLATPEAIAAGAEDGGEMGAHHHRHHLAGIRALQAKAADHAPFGLAFLPVYDRRLTRRPPLPAP